MRKLREPAMSEVILRRPGFVSRHRDPVVRGPAQAEHEPVGDFFCHGIVHLNSPACLRCGRKYMPGEEMPPEAERTNYPKGKQGMNQDLESNAAEPAL